MSTEPTGQPEVSLIVIVDEGETFVVHGEFENFQWGV